MLKVIFLTLVAISLFGCSSFTPPARMHEMDSTHSYWLDYDVTRRGTLISNTTSSSWKACAEPAPDAAIGMVAKLQGSLDIAGQGKAEGKGELSQSIVNLAEKTQMVLFLRESLFRLCELSINKDLNSQQTKELYESVLKSALALVEKEKAEIELNQKRLESADQAQFIYQYLNEKKVDPKIVEDLLKKMQ